MKKTILLTIIFCILLLLINCCSNPAYAEIKKETSQHIVIEAMGMGYIAGTITDSSGNPIEDAYVAAFSLGILPWMGEPDLSLVSTNSNGYYKITIPEGVYHVFAFKTGEGVAFASPVNVITGQTTIVDLSLSGSIIPGAATAPQSVLLNPLTI